MFRGINITVSKTGDVSIDQLKYAERLWTRFGTTRKTQPVPLPTYVDMSPATEEETEAMTSKGRKQYMTIVGALNWLTNTMVEIGHVVAALAEHTSNPAHRHLEAARGAVNYLKGRPKNSITYTRGTGDKEQPTLLAVSDASFDERRSYETGLVILGNGVVNVRVGRLTHVAESTYEAEINAAGKVVRMAQWNRAMLAEIGICGYDAHQTIAGDGKPPPWRGDAPLMPPLEPTILYVDAMSVVNAIRNPSVAGRTKHLAIRHHYLHDLEEKGVIKVQHIPTNLNPADLGTKPLAKVKFASLLPALYDFSGHVLSQL